MEFKYTYACSGREMLVVVEKKLLYQAQSLK